MARDKDRSIIQRSDAGPPEAVLESLEFSLLQWGAPGDSKMSGSCSLWLCMEDEFGGREEVGSAWEGAGSPWWGLAYVGLEMENQGRFQEAKWTGSVSGSSLSGPHLPLS